MNWKNTKASINICSIQGDAGGCERDESSFLTVLTKLHVCRPLADGLTVVRMWTRFHNVTEGWSSATKLLHVVWSSHRCRSNDLNLNAAIVTPDTYISFKTVNNTIFRRGQSILNMHYNYQRKIKTLSSGTSAYVHLCGHML